MRPLQRLIGTWLTEGVTVERGEDTNQSFTFFDHYAWLPGGHFIAHTVNGEIGGQSMRGLEIIGYEGRMLRATSYDSQGTVTHYRPKLDGLDWSLMGDKERFIGHFSPDGKRLEGIWERKARGNWNAFMRVSLKRVGDA